MVSEASKYLEFWFFDAKLRIAQRKSKHFLNLIYPFNILRRSESPASAAMSTTDLLWKKFIFLPRRCAHLERGSSFQRLPSTVAMLSRRTHSSCSLDWSLSVILPACKLFLSWKRSEKRDRKKTCWMILNWKMVQGVASPTQNNFVLWPTRSYRAISLPLKKRSLTHRDNIYSSARRKTIPASSSLVDSRSKREFIDSRKNTRL